MHAFIGALDNHAPLQVVAAQKARWLSLSFFLFFLGLAEYIQRRGLLSLTTEVVSLGLLNIQLAEFCAAFADVASEDVLFG